MILKELLKNYKLRGFDIEFKDLYGNTHKKKELTPEEVLKIEDLEVRNVNINFRLKKATFYLIDLYELMEGEK